VVIELKSVEQVARVDKKRMAASPCKEIAAIVFLNIREKSDREINRKRGTSELPPGHRWCAERRFRAERRGPRIG
jgi:hypothetical protein